MESLHPEGRIMALKAGANVVMPNITSSEYKNLYTLYPNKTNVDKVQSNTDIVAKITAIGRTIGKGYGEHKKKL
jgi:biotin synthase